jgi:hypothetical protein
MSRKRRHGLTYGDSLPAWMGLSSSLLDAPCATHPAGRHSATHADTACSTVQDRAPLPDADFEHTIHESAAPGKYHAEQRICHDPLAMVFERLEAVLLGGDLPDARSSPVQHIGLGQVEDSAQISEASDWRHRPRRAAITSRQFCSQSPSRQRRASGSTLPCVTSYRRGGEYR